MKKLLSVAAFVSLLCMVSLPHVFGQTPAPEPSPAKPEASPTPDAATPKPEPSLPPKVDFGDNSSFILTFRGWQSLDSKRYKDAVAYTSKCIALYKAKALEMQNALSAPPPTYDKDAVFAKWALNDVGTCYFILGRALEELGQTKKAIDAYKFLGEKLPYTECWDPKGWFWTPADAANSRAKVLLAKTPHK